VKFSTVVKKTNVETTVLQKLNQRTMKGTPVPYFYREAVIVPFLIFFGYFRRLSRRNAGHQGKERNRC
jgi:hypothetical protein